MSSSQSDPLWAAADGVMPVPSCGCWVPGGGEHQPLSSSASSPRLWSGRHALSVHVSVGSPAPRIPQGLLAPAGARCVQGLRMHGGPSPSCAVGGDRELMEAAGSLFMMHLRRDGGDWLQRGAVLEHLRASAAGGLRPDRVTRHRPLVSAHLLLSGRGLSRIQERRAASPPSLPAPALGTPGHLWGHGG